MCLFLVIAMANFNLCCLLITQCWQSGKLTILSPCKRLHSTRIFKPRYDMWPSLWCHIIIASSWLVVATNAYTSCNISPKSMHRLAMIFSALINTRLPFIAFKIPHSVWIFNYPTENRFFFKPFTCCIPWIVRMVPTYIFNLTVPTPAISKAWSFSMNTYPSKISS